MALRNQIPVALLLLFLFGCTSDKTLQKEYIFQYHVRNIQKNDENFLQFSGLSGHSMWGVDRLTTEKEQDKLVLTIHLKKRVRGYFSFEIKIPDDVNAIYLENDMIWQREGGNVHNE